MKTQLFNSYGEFLKREDKNINGVSESFSLGNTDYEKQNNTNKGCWDCENCNNCVFCTDCSSCFNCEKCSLCLGCNYCVECSGCYKCEKCKGCWHCSDCSELFAHSLYCGK